MRNVLSKCVVVVLMISVLFGGVVSADTSFKNREMKDEYNASGELLRDFGVISGDQNGNLKLDSYLTRAEAIVLVNRLTTKNESDFITPSKPTFKDVPVTHWAYVEVEKAFYYGRTTGAGNGNFLPSDLISYQDVLTLLIRSLGYTVGGADSDIYYPGVIIAARFNLLLDFLAPIRPKQNIKRGYVFDLIVEVLGARVKDSEFMLVELLTRYEPMSEQDYDSLRWYVHSYSLKDRFLNSAKFLVDLYGPERDKNITDILTSHPHRTASDGYIEASDLVTSDKLELTAYALMDIFGEFINRLIDTGNEGVDVSCEDALGYITYGAFSDINDAYTIGQGISYDDDGDNVKSVQTDIILKEDSITLVDKKTNESKEYTDIKVKRYDNVFLTDSVEFPVGVSYVFYGSDSEGRSIYFQVIMQNYTMGNLKGGNGAPPWFGILRTDFIFLAI